MSGLPGAGKDYWLSRMRPELPVVSLDAIRGQLGVDPSGPQGRVVQAAREQARIHLRRQEPFAWNATNLSRQMRDRQVRLFSDYGARIRIVYVEPSRERLLDQNRDRSSPVPEAVIERLQRRWEVPKEDEAHAVEWVVA